jgi:Asp-tRNA(Asn)/Glu-tRNA(Gln) amidotransferase A subunit family amidase
MAGPDRRDPNSTAQPPLDLARFGEGNLEGLTIGIYRAWFEHANRDVVACCDRVLTELVSRGASVVDVVIPDLGLLRTAHLVTIVSEMRASHGHHIKRNGSAYNLDTRLNLALAGHMLATDYVHAQRLRARFDDHFGKALRKADVLLTPTTACTAPIIPADALASGESNLEVTDRIMRFAPAANLTGLPAISCPAGYDSDGLPVGAQFTGRAWSEGLLLRLASVVETFVERRPPKVHRRLLS